MTKFKDILLIILAATVIFLLCRSCNPEIPDSSNVNVDSILNSIAAEQEEIATLKDLASDQTDTIYKERHHYHTIRSDSLIPCETKLIYCDTILVHDSIHDIVQDLIIAKQDTVIQNWRSVHSVDSASIHELKKDIRRQKWKTRGVIALWLIREGAGVIK